ncbi:hypothetical protein ACFQVC_20425 [Streptomyces monticola]|uniref:Uncharacterized protein n=1 Tax=Streptomyces monticola TaxID=2666263 RepID=A0ABW2JMK3_9ACTN
MMTRHAPARAVLAGSAAVLLLGLAAPNAAATPDTIAPDSTAPSATPAGDDAPSTAARAAAHEAAGAPATLDTLSRFFSREGAVTKAAADPRVQGRAAVPVYYLSPEFVAGEKGAPVARLEFLASKAVSSDGQEASLWTVKQGGEWQVVNIATGDDETHYARVGADKLPGGRVFHEPQIDAWYVERHARVLPIDKDAAQAIGSAGTSLSAYQKRVERAYGDKLPGSAYAESGKAGGYAPRPAAPPPEARDDAPPAAQGDAPAAATRAQAVATRAQGGTGVDPALTVASAAAGLGAACALALGAARAVRVRRRNTAG